MRTKHAVTVPGNKYRLTIERAANVEILNKTLTVRDPSVQEVRKVRYR